MAPSKEKWVRRFLITETSRYKKGFTVYKVTSVIYPKAAPEAVSRVSIWKRYNDFRKLHSELSSKVESLKIKEPFPPFPKPKFFGRFQAEVIEERRQCAIRLLEFIAKHTPLFTSNVFVKFFECGLSSDYLAPDCSLSTGSDTSEDDLNLNSALTGTNYFPTPVTETTPDNRIEKCKDLDVCNTNSILKVDNSPENLSSNNNYLEEIDHLNEEIVDICKTESTICRTDREACQLRFVTDSPNSYPELRIKERVLGSAPNNSAVHDGSDLPDGAAQGSSYYILVAAAHMSAAFQHEAICEYEEAFTQYKLGISNLLNGVQLDPDLGRRATVKEKVSKYLDRAEKLYNRHLNCNISILSKPVAELQNYKVLRVMGSVMLVRDTSRDCNRVIKTVQKPAGSGENLSDYILRGKIPFMVELHACIQTEFTIFLVLQHASGGKLWEYMKSYYRGRNTVLNCEKSHTRSASCDAIIQSSLEKKLYMTEKEPLRAPEITYHTDQLIACNEEIVDPENSLQKLEAEFGANSACSMNFLTTDLLAKAQELLRSVDATLKKSNSIASRLNESESLMYLQNSSDYKRNLNGGDNCEAECTKNNQINRSSNVNSFRNISTDNTSPKENGTTKIIESNSAEPVLTNSQQNFVHDFENIVLTPEISIKAPNNVFSENESHGSVKEVISPSKDSCESSQKLFKSNNFQCLVNEDSGVEMDDELWKLPEGTIRFWAAEILLTLEALHQQDLIIGDLKPDNILLGNGGHVAMSYIVPRRNFEFLQLKKPYSAPELCNFVPTMPPSSVADIWSYGILLYELFTGIQFQSKHPGPFHSHSILNIPEELSSNVKSLISNTLRYQPDERLTIPEIKEHPFFSSIDWSSLANSSLT